MTGNTGSMRSVEGELGLRLAARYELSKHILEPYIQASAIKEFVNSNETTINNTHRFSNNTDGLSGRYSVGASLNISHSAQVYTELSYRQGENTESPVQGVSGIKINF